MKRKLLSSRLFRPSSWRATDPLLALLLVFSIAGYQNCTGCESSSQFQTGSSQAPTGGTGPTGNGEPYDMKPMPGEYLRRIPGYTCGGTKLVYQSLTVTESKAVLRSIDESTCREVDTDLELSALSARTYNPDYVGFEKGAFEKKENIPDPHSINQPFPEAWCQTIGANAESLDLVIREDLSNGALGAKAFSPGGVTSEVGISRVRSPGTLEYRTSRFVLVIDASTSRGLLTYAQADGSAKQFQASCRTAGWIDERQSAKPAFALNFSAAALPTDVNFSRASVGSYVDATGTLRTAIANSPRFDHDPVSGALKGLLIESTKTNFALFSEQLENPVYVRTALSLQANRSVAPDGTTTAALLVPDTTSGYHFLSQDFGGHRLDSPKACSVFVRPNGITRGMLKIEKAANDMVQLEFDLSNGSNNAVAFGTGSRPAGSITALANGWYRLSVSGIVDTSTAVQLVSCSLFVGMGPVGGSTYTGDGVSGLYAWGFQLEDGVQATSYIPTGAVAVTRASDQVSVANPTWYSLSSGTVFALAARSHFSSDAADGLAPIFSFEGTNGSERSVVFDPSAGITARLRNDTLDPLSSWSSLVAPQPGLDQRVVLSYGQTANPSLVVNGSTASGPSVPPQTSLPSTLRIGGSGTGESWSGHPKSLIYWPTRLTDAASAELTN